MDRTVPLTVEKVSSRLADVRELPDDIALLYRTRFIPALQTGPGAALHLSPHCYDEQEPVVSVKVSLADLVASDDCACHEHEYAVAAATLVDVGLHGVDDLSQALAVTFAAKALTGVVPVPTVATSAADARFAAARTDGTGHTALVAATFATHSWGQIRDLCVERDGRIDGAIEHWSELVLTAVGNGRIFDEAVAEVDRLLTVGVQSRGTLEAFLASFDSDRTGRVWLRESAPHEVDNELDLLVPGDLRSTRPSLLEQLAYDSIHVDDQKLYLLDAATAAAICEDHAATVDADGTDRRQAETALALWTSATDPALGQLARCFELAVALV